MSSHPEVGKLITTPQTRDAIHIAIAPVQAGETLYPGEHIKRLDGKWFIDSAKSGAVVDPFLQDRVQPHEWFFVFLKPGTITSLRHEWTHPDFL